MYIERQLEKKFIAVSEEYACVLLTGPRQVGKSTMLRHLMEGRHEPRFRWTIWRSAGLPKPIPRCS